MIRYIMCILLCWSAWHPWVGVRQEEHGFQSAKLNSPMGNQQMFPDVFFYVICLVFVGFPVKRPCFDEQLWKS